MTAAGYTDIATIKGSRSAKGWHVSIDLELAVEKLSTPEEQAALFEKIACTASARGARIRQNISAGED